MANIESANRGRRHDQRRAARVRVHVQARYISPTLNLDGFVTDVSPEGAFFGADYLDGQGQLARVILVTGAGQSLDLQGEVRWVGDGPVAGGMGLRFLDLSVEEREVLSQLAGQGASDSNDAEDAHASFGEASPQGNC